MNGKKKKKIKRLDLLRPLQFFWDFLGKSRAQHCGQPGVADCWFPKHLHKFHASTPVFFGIAETLQEKLPGIDGERTWPRKLEKKNGNRDNISGPKVMKFNNSIPKSSGLLIPIALTLPSLYF